MPILNPPKKSLNDPFKKTLVQVGKEIEKEKIMKEALPMSFDGLPEAPTSQTPSMTSLIWTMVAPPGWGKSELFSMFPESLMLSFEAGHKFIDCYKVIIDEWESTEEPTTDNDGNSHMSFMQAIDLIEKQQSMRFKFIIWDTIDAAIKKCVDHFVGKAKVAHISELGDYGKGYTLAQNDPMRKAINRLLNTGRGLGIITHQKINTNVFTKGPKSKKETTLPNGIWELIYPQSDIILHGEFGEIRKPNKHRDRIIKSEGNEDMLAKNRGGILPPAWIAPLQKEKRIEQLMGFFGPQRITKIAEATQQYQEIYED